MNKIFNINEFERLNDQYCSSNYNDQYTTLMNKKIIKESRIKQQCFKASYIKLLLTDVFKIELTSSNIELLPLSYDDDIFVHWSIGKLLTMLITPSFISQYCIANTNDITQIKLIPHTMLYIITYYYLDDNLLY